MAQTREERLAAKKAYRDRIRTELQRAREREAEEGRESLREEGREEARSETPEPRREEPVRLSTPRVPTAATTPRRRGAPNYRVHVLVALAGAAVIRLLGESGNVIRSTAGK